MKKVNVVLEFDEQELGEKWMNIYNLKLILFDKWFTKEELLRVVSFDELEKGK